MPQMIEVTIRKWGSYSSYLECGKYKTDAFGDTVWERETYPNKDNRLKIKEDMDGRYGKASTYTTVKIIVPDNYPLIIREKGNGKQSSRYVEDLYTPK